MNMAFWKKVSFLYYISCSGIKEISLHTFAYKETGLWGVTYSQISYAYSILVE